MRTLVRAIVVVCAVWVFAGAKPVIKVSSDVYDADTVIEGKRDEVSHSFVIRNTGDEPLTIKSVRPG